MKPEELHLKSGARNAIEGDGWKFEAVKDFTVFDGFSCADHDLDEFLHEDAQNYQSRLISMTYAYSFTDKEKVAPVAFASIANCSMSLLDKHRITHFLKDIPFRELPCVKIGRLGVRGSVQGKGVGTSLLNIIKELFTTNNRTGCRFLTVDAYNNSQTLNFYKKSNYSTKHESVHEAWLNYRFLAPSQLLLRPRTVEPLQSGNKSMCNLRLAMVRRTMPGSVRQSTKPKNGNSAINRTW